MYVVPNLWDCNVSLLGMHEDVNKNVYSLEKLKSTFETPTMKVWKMICLFNWVIFTNRFHVNVHQCTSLFQDKLRTSEATETTNVSQRIRLVTGTIILRDSSQFECPKVQYIQTLTKNSWPLKNWIISHISSNPIPTFAAQQRKPM